MDAQQNLKAKLYRQEKFRNLNTKEIFFFFCLVKGIYIAHVTPISVRSQEFSGGKKTAYSCQTTYLSVNKKVTFWGGAVHVPELN